jgi:hypothetical protein
VYYHLDATPTHSYLKSLYKYPQAEFPYAKLVEENARRGKELPEFELLDTGVFDTDRYFDVFIEYAKADADDIVIRITVHNRGPEAATIHVLPQIWFRNTWSWDVGTSKPVISPGINDSLEIVSQDLGKYRAYLSDAPEFLFCDNETNTRRLFGDANARGYFKDAINDYVVDGKKDAVNPGKTGTKAAAHYKMKVAAGKSIEIKARLTNVKVSAPFAKFDSIFKDRIADADAFYAELQRDIPDPDTRLVQRQALAG